MNTKAKRRMAVSAGIVVIVLVVVLAVVGGNSAAKTVSKEDELVVSFKIGKVDEQGNPLAGAAFVLKDSNGNKVTEWTSQTTAKDISSNLKPGGTYVLEETKAPDGYEICVKQYKITVAIDGTVKVEGVVKPGTLGGIDAKVRFTIADGTSGAELPVRFAGALSDDVAEGAHVVLTGAMSADGMFEATNVALEG